MRNLSLLITLGLIFVINLSSFSQQQTTPTEPDYASYPYWIDMMQDPEANYYETVKAFEEYWKDREITRSSGWKPFKRWEYSMQFMINPDGSRVNPENDLIEYNKFLQNNPTSSRDFTGNWINLGPFNLPQGDRGYKGLGRINSLAFHPTDADIIFIGAPAGGMWRSDDGGTTWTSNTDDLPSLGVSSIVVDYTDPDVIFIGTGDRDAGDAAGVGVMKSTDGGLTWEMSNTGMGNKIVGRMIQHPTTSQTMLAATNGGIYKTTDNGANWTMKEGGNFKEIVFKADDPSVVFAAKGGDFFKSTDTGETWTEIDNGLPGGARGVIGVTPDDPNVVYFLLCTSSSFKGLYRSSDVGQSFTEQSDSPNIMSWGCEGGSGGQAWYDLDIAIDPNDADVIYAGGVNCFKSVDGGVTWDISSHWWGDCSVPSVHADLHILEWNPVDGRLYVGNDGGIYYTDNGGSSWPELTEGLPIGQVYKIGQSATERNMCVNGYQDNGTSTYMGDFWVNVFGGDGMECAVDHGDASISYATIYYGDIYKITNNGSSKHVAGNGVGGITESGAWVTPFCLNNRDADVMFVGYKNIWRCENIKGYNPSWEKISNNLGGSNGSNMRCVEHSPAEAGLFYAARSDNKFFRSDNIMEDTPTWTDLSTFLPTGGTTPTDVEAHPTDPEVVYITHDNKVYKSSDRGINWEDMTANLPNTSLNTIEYYKNSPDGLYVGSNVGVFYRDNSMTEWVLFADGLPATSRFTEIEIYYHPDSVANDVIRASTYGRGLWESEPYYYQPTADFYASETTIPVGCALDFFDNSTGIPHYWSWTFEGATPATSTEQNPTGIVFNEEGTFNVTLVISNPEGTDSITKEAYITVSATAVPNVDFIASTNAICVGETVYFTDLTENCPTAWHWSFDPGTITYLDGTSESSQNPVVQFDGAGSYTVSLTAVNTAGSSSNTKTDYIHSGGIGIPFIEDFEMGTFAERSWGVDNPDNDKTWAIDTVQGTSPGNRAAWMNFFNYYSMGARDRLISPSLDFSAYPDVYLSFKHAYAQRYNQKDSLIVYISTDCGTTWERVWGMGPDGSGVFATAPANAEFFAPASEDDWCDGGNGANCFTIDLSAWGGMSDVKIAFESYNNFGNNLYLDNVLVDFTYGTEELDKTSSSIAVIPNPSQGLFTVSIDKIEGSVEMQIFDLMGNKIYNKSVNPGTSVHRESIDLSAYAKGIYFIRITNESINSVKKIIIE